MIFVILILIILFSLEQERKHLLKQITIENLNKSTK